MHDNKKNILNIPDCESGELFLGFFKQYPNELMAARMLEGVELSNKNLPDDFLVNHISSSFVGMVQWWMKNNLKETPEELAGYFMSVITPVI